MYSIQLCWRLALSGTFQQSISEIIRNSTIPCNIYKWINYLITCQSIYFFFWIKCSLNSNNLQSAFHNSHRNLPVSRVIDPKIKSTFFQPTLLVSPKANAWLKAFCPWSPLDFKIKIRNVCQASFCP